jgi:hypothetical protein
MTIKIKLILLILLITVVIAYQEWRISAYDLKFYHGKDGGIFCRLESILFLGSLFFIVMARTKKILFLFLGFFVSLVSSILLYLAFAYSNLFETDLVFHVASCFAFIIVFFWIEK